MFYFVWHSLPEPTWVKVGVVAVGMVVVLAVLFGVVFPAVESMINPDVVV